MTEFVLGEIGTTANVHEILAVVHVFVIENFHQFSGILGYFCFADNERSIPIDGTSRSQLLRRSVFDPGCRNAMIFVELIYQIAKLCLLLLNTAVQNSACLHLS